MERAENGGKNVLPLCFPLSDPEKQDNAHTINTSKEPSLPLYAKIPIVNCLLTKQPKSQASSIFHHALPSLPVETAV